MSIDLAIKAKLPLIHVTTTDTVHVSRVLKHISGQPEVTRWGGDEVSKGCVYFSIGAPWSGEKGTKTEPVTEDSLEKVYDRFKQNSATMVVVNLDKVPTMIFDAGELPTPKALKKVLLTDTLKMEQEKADDLMAALGGLTLTETEWALRLTHVKEKSLTRVGIGRTRKKVFPPKPGLEQVDTDASLYVCPPELAKWIDDEMPFFLKEPDHRLRPKGILFDGPPGTGKTAGAKHIARTLGVPLFRFSSADVKSKWVGESEGNLKRTLQAAAHEAPCVLLLDELEKLFSTGFMDSSGVSSNLLADFLWFMQENESRVLIVATTNAKGNIPAPMIRPGRIDRHMELKGLKTNELMGFMHAIAESFGLDTGHPELEKLVGQLASESQKAEAYTPQANAEQAVIDLVKSLKSAAYKAEEQSPTPKKAKAFTLKN